MNLIPDKKETDSFLTKDRTIAIAKIECYYTLNNFFHENQKRLVPKHQENKERTVNNCSRPL